VDIKAIERDWRGRGFTFGIWTDPPGRVWEGYVHDADELFLLLEGDVELEVGDRRWCPAPGQEVLIPKGVVHTVRNVGQTTSRWLYGYSTGS
jgi:mannose-6-phosphate isomerase-like protein (cupin superfamily)